jgi:hypothetical protein
MQHVFTTSTNEIKRNITNIKFEAELEENLSNDDLYQNKSTLERFLFLCEDLIVKCKKLNYDSALQEMKSKEVSEDGEGIKKARGKSTGYKAPLIATVEEHCETPTT